MGIRRCRFIMQVLTSLVGTIMVRITSTPMTGPSSISGVVARAARKESYNVSATVPEFRICYSRRPGLRQSGSNSFLVTIHYLIYHFKSLKDDINNPSSIVGFLEMSNSVVSSYIDLDRLSSCERGLLFVILLCFNNSYNLSTRQYGAPSFGTTE
ncbi:hypothetical protein AVEN_170477-1 [Araneus ventricosus]|uniref:Secreted protein n=1 Tax=Araneus ventricosus TaxID=182803 RepID=A0A4Y2BYP9_ARAVE|nr:hypothetical protein AVEN_170477-1 [Araneus ventricosus]